MQMMNRFISLLAACMALTSANAQIQKPASFSRMDMGVQRLVRQHALNKGKHKVAPATQESVTVIVGLMPDADITAQRLEALGGRVQWMHRTAACVEIPVTQLETLAALDGVRQVEMPQMRRPMVETSRTAAHVNEAQDATKAAAAGLPKTFTGKGVLVGVIDTGIDPTHMNFRTTTGDTRIQKYYSYTTTKAEDMVAYTDPTEILNAKPCTTQSHGSHVMGCAAGSDSKLKGMAPEADLLAADLQYLSDAAIIDAVRNMAQEAEERQQPLVMNLSLGSTAGFHDGCEAFSQMADELTENGTRKGLAIMVSAGNSGDIKCCATHTFSATRPTADMILEPTQQQLTFSGEGESYPTYMMSQQQLVEVFSSNNADIDLGLAAYDVTTGQRMNDDAECVIAHLYTVNYNGETYNSLVPFSGSQDVGYRFLNVEELMEALIPFGQFGYFTHTCVDGVTQKKGFLLDLYSTEIYVLENCRLALEMTCMTPGTKIVGYNMVNGTDAPFGSYNFPNVLTPNSDYTINTMVCTESVISVGAFCHKNTFSNYLDRTWQYAYPLNQVASFSSYGFTGHDEPLFKPDVLAPGVAILSSTNNQNTTTFKANRTPTAEVAADLQNTLYGYTDFQGKHNWWQWMSGTSMASPVAAGIVALWLEACPTLTSNQLREVLQNSCTPYTDTSVSPLRRSRHGQINALEGLRYITSTITGIDYLDEGQRPTETSAPIYNLQGQSIAAPTTRGLYIQGGQKKLVR